MHVLLSILQALGIHSINWGAVVTVLTSATAVSVVLQLIKHFGKLQEAQKTVMVLLGVLSAGAGYADQVLSFNSSNPKLLSGTLMLILTAAVYIHRFAVSPLYWKIVNFLNGIYADAKAYRAEQANLQAVNQAPQKDQEFTLPS